MKPKCAGTSSHLRYRYGSKLTDMVAALTHELCCLLPPAALRQQCSALMKFETAVTNAHTHARVRTNKYTRETGSRLMPLINHFIKNAFLAIKGNRNAR